MHLGRLLSLFVPASLALLPACEKKCRGDSCTNYPTVSLFGFEETQLHRIHNTLELHRNVLLVRYDPRHPERLEWVNCPVQAEYTYVQAPGRRVESMYVRNSAELRAKVPIQAARLEGYMRSGSGLEFNYVTIGSWELVGKLQIPKNDPECARATHYVTTLSVGAYDFAEGRSIEGGIDATVAGTDVGGGVHGSREKGKAHSVGDLDACVSGETAVTDCFTPLQIMMMPIVDREWASDQQAAQWVASGGGGNGGTTASGTDTQPTSHQTSLALFVDENRWRPGSFMAYSLQQVLVLATRIDETTNYGYDDQGSTLVAGYLTPSAPQTLNRYFEAGKSYALLATGATDEGDLDIVIYDQGGYEVAADRERTGEFPMVVFTPTASGTYSAQLVLNEREEEFGAMVIMVDGGVKISPDILQGAFQGLLDNGTGASEVVIANGYPNGLIFHERDWALQGTILYPNELIRQTDVKLDPGAGVFTAIAHDPAMNIDLRVTNMATGEIVEDLAPEHSAVVVVPSDGVATFDVATMYGEGTGATLATGLILKIAE